MYKKIANFNSIKESQILITSGIDGGIQNLISVLTNAGDVIGVFSPTYAMYEVYSKIFQVECFQIKYSENYKLNLNDLDKFFEINPKILFVPNPNQPIESSLDLKELTSLAKRCKEKNCFLVLDEAYHLFGADTGISLLNNFDNIIILRTFSKAFGVPSIRAGYTMSTEENMNIISKTRIAHELNSMSIAVAEYLLDNINIVYDYCEKIKISRTKVLNELKKLELSARGKHGNYILITFKKHETAKKIVDYFKKKLVYIKGPYKSPWDKCVGITVGPEELMQKFILMLREAKSENLF